MERVCTIRMDEQTLNKLEAYCKHFQKAKSEAIREAINKMVDEAETFLLVSKVHKEDKSDE